MRNNLNLSLAGVGLAVLIGLAPNRLGADDYTLIGWNNLGMHCMDGADYSVFSLLPPYNTINAQLIAQGLLVTNTTGVTVTYEALPDPSGSINMTSQGKANFWNYAQVLYGAAPAMDMGLAGYGMPGPANQPQAMGFDTNLNWFNAEGIPITPYDDAGVKNTYPMMRLTARDSSGAVLATTDIVLPVSDEMDCKGCHLSGANPITRPFAGWSWNANQFKDYRSNILRLHDDYQKAMRPVVYSNLLAQAGYNTAGLYPTAVSDGKAVLCARCHASNALPGTGITGVSALTRAMHYGHAFVTDPLTGQTLDSASNRSACYRCHPGSETRCLRGAMGSAVASDGTLAIQCQSCHGSMSMVGADTRQGWLEEPSCQSCHTGTALSNAGQIRFTSSFDTPGHVRQTTNSPFATSKDTPAAGLSLFRFSTGHGGLRCEACHGSTHAEFPSIHPNDNIQSVQIQGHTGMLTECANCHTNNLETFTGGPHGMHPVGPTWISNDSDVGGMVMHGVDHHAATEQGGVEQCKACHGQDLRGTVLSRMLADRTMDAFGTRLFWKGSQIGCYNCHPGPDIHEASLNQAPVVNNVSATTTAGVPVRVNLTATDADQDPCTLRIVSQPTHGSVGLSNNVATYYPGANYVGSDSFTFAAWDGSTDSNLGVGSVTVTAGQASLTAQAAVPPSAPVYALTPFWATLAASNLTERVVFDWNFGDGSPHGSSPLASHVYTSAGTFQWTLTATANGKTATATGPITINATAEVPRIWIQRANDKVVLSWSTSLTNCIIECSENIHLSNGWTTVTNHCTVVGNLNCVTNDYLQGRMYYRIKQP